MRLATIELTPTAVMAMMAIMVVMMMMMMVATKDSTWS
jgi:hypothetical protein